MENKFNIIGYSGHSFVILDSAIKLKLNCTGYYDINKKELNPFNLDYLGLEDNIVSKERIFITIGDNNIRRNIYEHLIKKSHNFLNIIDPTSSVSKFASIKPESLISIGINSVINSLVSIETGVIINTASVIEHEVKIEKFSHIGPNATVCGGVSIEKMFLLELALLLKKESKLVIIQLLVRVLLF